MLSHVIKIKNGDHLEDYAFYNCDSCNELMECAWPIFRQKESDYCPSCAFKLNIITSESFVNNVGGFSSSMFKAAINPDSGEIEICPLKSKFSWDKNDKDDRSDFRYKEWRTSVFKRDKYTCQHCHGIGGELNAHHIKLFSKFKKLRYAINNGLTLCIECHKEEHKRIRVGD